MMLWGWPYLVLAGCNSDRALEIIVLDGCLRAVPVPDTVVLD